MPLPPRRNTESGSRWYNLCVIPVRDADIVYRHEHVLMHSKTMHAHTRGVCVHNMHMSTIHIILFMCCPHQMCISRRGRVRGYVFARRKRRDNEVRQPRCCLLSFISVCGAHGDQHTDTHTAPRLRTHTNQNAHPSTAYICVQFLLTRVGHHHNACVRLCVCVCGLDVYRKLVLRILYEETCRALAARALSMTNAHSNSMHSTT